MYHAKKSLKCRKGISPMLLCPLFAEAVSGTNDFTNYSGATTEVQQKFFGTREDSLWRTFDIVVSDNFFSNFSYNNIVSPVNIINEQRISIFFSNLSVILDCCIWNVSRTLYLLIMQWWSTTLILFLTFVCNIFPFITCHLYVY